MSIAFIASAVHKDSLSSRLNEQRKDGSFCDVLLKVSGQVLPTHSCILTACSPFFQGLICGERPTPPFLTDVPQEIELVMPGIEGPQPGGGQEGGGLEAVMDLLDYIYTGNIELKEDSVDLVVQLAEVFMLDGLSSLIQTYMNESAKQSKMSPLEATSSKPPSTPHGRTKQLLMLQRRRQRRVVSRGRPAGGWASRGRPAGGWAARGRGSANSARAVANKVGPDVFEPEVRMLRSRKRSAPSVNEVADGDNMTPEEEPDSSEEDEEDGGDGPAAKRNHGYSFRCKQCNFVSGDRDAIRDHKVIHPSRAYKCLTCEYSTGQCSKLLQHLLAADHPETECSVCGFTADDRETLRDHLERHDLHKPFLCGMCEYQCRTQAQLEMHVATHDSEGVIPTATYGGTPDRPHVCEVCNRGFKSKYSMQTHLLSHANSSGSEANFACTQCDYRTTNKTNLKAHERTHNGSLYKCTSEGCDYECVSKSELQVHILKHSDPQPFSCEVCGQKYAQKNSLKRHVKIHNLDEYLLQCGQCDFTTTRSDKMRNHMNKMHPDEPTEDPDGLENADENIR